MHCRVATPKSTEFKSRLGFNQYDIATKKEQTVVKSIMDTFEGENMQTRYCFLGYKIDLYFRDYKLAIEVDENDHINRKTDCEIKRQKALEKELDCKFIIINPDKEGFSIFKAQNEIFRHIKESSKN